LSKICLVLTAKTISRNLEILNKYRKFANIAELRVDCLDSDEQLHIRRFPELAGLPVILTIRRDIDGGYYKGGEGARVNLFAKGLSFANVDSRYNFAYIDIEEDFDVPSLEEAARTFGTRIIRSYHNTEGFIDDIPAKIASLRRVGDEIVKVALAANSIEDVLKMFMASKACPNDIEKILVCMGHYGICSRVLAEKFGSLLSYSSALSENVTPGALGQLDIQDIAELYRFQRISGKTKVLGIVGYPLKNTFSPWFFNTIFGMENTDAVYVPFPADSVHGFFELAKELDVEGISVTTPYKETVLSKLYNCSDEVQAIGACNTLTRTPEGWFGENTDGKGFSHSILALLEIKNLKRRKITIIGAGGIARAVASEVYRLGGKALILNRTAYKAKNIALKYNFQWGALDEHGIEKIHKFSDIIIQASSAGMDGREKVDPIEGYTFTGKEIVMDIIYTPVVTRLLKRATGAGCRTINGYDMLIRQAFMQYTLIMGKEIPYQTLSRINAQETNTWNRIQTDF